MSNLGSTLIKITALAGGAVLGAILSRIVDETMTKQAEERSQRDKMRYAQGLPSRQTEPKNF